MTWKEYYKENSDKIPKEFADKEITVDDCLKIMDAMSFTIKELLDKTKWHTGIPTEEGLYVVLTKATNKGIQSSEGAYILDWWDGYCFKNLKQMAMHDPVFSNDIYSWVKWQKIDLYKE